MGRSRYRISNLSSLPRSSLIDPLIKKYSRKNIESPSRYSNLSSYPVKKYRDLSPSRNSNLSSCSIKRYRDSIFSPDRLIQYNKSLPTDSYYRLQDSHTSQNLLSSDFSYSLNYPLSPSLRSTKKILYSDHKILNSSQLHTLSQKNYTYRFISPHRSRNLLSPSYHRESYHLDTLSPKRSRLLSKIGSSSRLHRLRSPLPTSPYPITRQRRFRSVLVKKKSLQSKDLVHLPIIKRRIKKIKSKIIKKKFKKVKSEICSTSPIEIRSQKRRRRQIKKIKKE